MKKVDRLLIKARKAFGQFNKQLSSGFITYIDSGEHAGQWEARADLWDGKMESMKPEDMLYSYHSTQEEALDAIKAVWEAYTPAGLCKPSFQDIPILIDDLSTMKD